MYPANTPNIPNTSNTSYNPYNPWRSFEQAAANAEPAPDRRAARGFWSGRFGVILAVVTVVVTVAALALAVVAAPLRAAQAGAAPPAGFTQVYDAGPVDNGTWKGADSCVFTSQGLDVDGGIGGTACTFQPSADSDLTSAGFWIQATVAPAASVQADEVPVILVGRNEPILFDQQGSYLIECNDQSTSDSTLPCAEGTTTAWHTNPYVANTVAVSYDAGSATLTVYANGQLVARVPLTQGNQPTLALGAGGDGEALFTHVSIYSGNGSAGG